MAVTVLEFKIPSLRRNNPDQVLRVTIRIE